jgi:thiamine-phosphate pyrophosphorylase
MRLVIISPESADPRELPAVEGFFAAGLERYHLRKPSWSSQALADWLDALPPVWRPRVILHQHPSLAATFGLGGTHDRDVLGNAAQDGCSRSCHDLGSLRRHLAGYPALLFGPVFPSLTKPGYGPSPDFPWQGLKSVLAERSPAHARVIAVGGVTAAGLPRCLELGFDGAAVLGAVWGSRDPQAAFQDLRDAAAKLEAQRHAA